MREEILCSMVANPQLYSDEKLIEIIPKLNFIQLWRFKYVLRNSDCPRETVLRRLEQWVEIIVNSCGEE